MNRKSQVFHVSTDSYGVTFKLVLNSAINYFVILKRMNDLKRKCHVYWYIV